MQDNIERTPPPSLCALCELTGTHIEAHDLSSVSPPAAGSSLPHFLSLSRTVVNARLRKLGSLVPILYLDWKVHSLSRREELITRGIR